MQWPPNNAALLVAFAAAFQEVEVTGNMALKTGQNLLRKHWQSTEKEEKKRDSNNLFWVVKAISVSFVLWLFNRQQNTNSRPLFPSIFCFLLFLNNELTKWKHTPPPPPHSWRPSFLHSVLSTLTFDYRTCVSASVCADELGCSFLLSVSCASSSSRSFNSCSISFLASLTLEYSL